MPQEVKEGLWVGYSLSLTLKFEKFNFSDSYENQCR